MGAPEQHGLLEGSCVWRGWPRLGAPATPEPRDWRRQALGLNGAVDPRGAVALEALHPRVPHPHPPVRTQHPGRERVKPGQTDGLLSLRGVSSCTLLVELRASGLKCPASSPFRGVAEVTLRDAGVGPRPAKEGGDAALRPGLVQLGNRDPCRWKDLLNRPHLASGYGNLSPRTMAARLFCISFALVGIPLNLVVLNRLGHLMQQGVHRCSRRLGGVWKVRGPRGAGAKDESLLE